MEGTEQNQMMNPIIVTGATGAMGSVAVRSLAAEGIPVIMACRDLQKGETLRKEILETQPQARLELMRLELGSVRDVNEFLSAIGERKLGGIFNNAGVLPHQWSMTEDGMEHTFAVNFVNPSYLTLHLLPNFEKRAHIVNMVSIATHFISINKGWAENQEKDFARIRLYSRSKLAFLLFSIALARKHPEFYVNVSDPGIVNTKMITMDKWFDPLTDIFFRPFIFSPERGVSPALRALKAQSSLEYYVGKKNDTIPKRYLNHPMVEVLWKYVYNLSTGINSL